ncbi:MAG: segregation/condensation protein A [Opitutaceae bacterium]|nr:segregation/condensation protein A [Cytophagales bacterium]
MSFEVKLPLFEGPFDLLLFFIERDELDIYDIPISKIAAEFLDYVHHLEKMNMDLASEFILVAATLMNIKSKMLLPRPQLDTLGNEVDPREELIQKLLEYKKYKNLVLDFTALEEIRLKQEPRGNVLSEIKGYLSLDNAEDELQNLDLYKLLKVYQKLMRKFEDEESRPVHTVAQYSYTVDGQKEIILERLRERTKLAFSEFFDQYSERIGIVFSFLAVLEMLQMELINIWIGEGYNNFWIELKEGQVQSVN